MDARRVHTLLRPWRVFLVVYIGFLHGMIRAASGPVYSIDEIHSDGHNEHGDDSTDHTGTFMVALAQTVEFLGRDDVACLRIGYDKFKNKWRIEGRICSSYITESHFGKDG